MRRAPTQTESESNETSTPPMDDGPPWPERNPSTAGGALFVSAAPDKIGEAVGAPALASFAEAFRFWLKLGFISFGGPAGQIAIMHTELVERRRWISEKRFLHALNYCML